MTLPTVTLLLDAASSSQMLRFAHADAIIEAFEPSELTAAFNAMEAARAKGRHLAGWFAYELGYALESKLAKGFWKRRDLPLVWFSVFDAPKQVARDDLHAEGRAYAGPLQHRWDEAAYRIRFEQTKEYIAAGDIYQANLSFRSHFPFAGDPFALFLALRDRAGARHCAYVDMGARQILSLSPELFFKISKNGLITARPMKGTAPRADDPAADKEAALALAASEKNRAENLMIVDLLRNDLGRIAAIGSVTVPELFKVEAYPTLHTMVSTIQAQLQHGLRFDDILRALFPCGSVTGAPKIRAMEIIRELEADPRGIYCGAIGHIAPDGVAEFNVAIRTIMVEAGRGTLGIGGAVVQDSTANAEYDECLLKSRFFNDVRKPLGLIETLRWDGGFVRLDRHLARMARSAAALGLPFDQKLALEALYFAVDARTEPLRVRLVLDEVGEFQSSALPLEIMSEHWTFAVSPHRTNSHDLLLRHKTTWREFYDGEHQQLEQILDTNETLFLNERGELTEGSRTNIFIRREGALLTPSVACGLLDGVLRQELIEEGRCHEMILTIADLASADEIFLGNSLRGLVPAVPAKSADLLSHEPAASARS